MKWNLNQYIKLYNRFVIRILKYLIIYYRYNLMIAIIK
jgi:hypothetical protein